MRKLHFALIGAGKHGTRWINIIKEIAYLDYIVDPKIKGSASLEDILRSNVDAVLIATPHKYHSLITKQALLYGKHVFCEKPAGIKADQIIRNSILAYTSDLVYKIGYNYHYYDSFIRAKKLFNKGVIGDLVFIRARHGFGGRKGYEKEWRINSELGGGGHLHDQGVHMINMAQYFMDYFIDVKGMRSSNYWKSGTEDNTFVLLKDINNATAMIHSSLTQWKRMHSFEIYGTKGYLQIDGLGKRYGKGEKLTIGLRTKDPDVVKEKVIICNDDSDNSLRLELKEFISAITKDTDINPTAEDCALTLRIVEQVYKESPII